MALEINSQNFDTLIAGDQPVVLDFGATWCGPCQMVAPIIEELAKEYEGKVVIGKCASTRIPSFPAASVYATSLRSSSSRAVKS